MEVDVQSLVVGGVSAFVLLLFLVQTVKEALSLESKFIPTVAAVLGVLLMLAAATLPEGVLVAMAQGLALAAAVSLSVRYVKESPHAKEPETLQGNHVPFAGSRETRATAETTRLEGRQSGLRYSGETQPLPDYQEDEWSRNRYG